MGKQILSEEQIEALIADLPLAASWGSYHTLTEFARAIEAEVLAKVGAGEPVAYMMSGFRGQTPDPVLCFPHEVECYADWVKRTPLYASPPEARGVPEGWQLVPQEPTPAMCVAGFCVSEAEHDPAGVYRAMLAAAPSPAKEGE